MRARWHIITPYPPPSITWEPYVKTIVPPDVAERAQDCIFMHWTARLHCQNHCVPALQDWEALDLLPMTLLPPHLWNAARLKLSG
jgi:hypothetical protein